jgi:hypothetical protein
MKSVSEDVKDMLIAHDTIDLVFGQDLFIGIEPAKIAQTVTLFDTPGKGPELSLNDGKFQHEGLQVRVKGYGYDTQYALANKVMAALHGRANETWNGSLYLIIYATNAPALLDWEDDGRVRLIINFIIQRKV